jgi:hypothetical protein
MPRWCERNSSVTTAQMVCRPWSSGPVLQHPSRKKPVIGSVPHDSSSLPRTFRSVFGRASEEDGVMVTSMRRQMAGPSLVIMTPGWLHVDFESLRNLGGPAAISDAICRDGFCDRAWRSNVGERCSRCPEPSSPCCHVLSLVCFGLWHSATGLGEEKFHHCVSPFCS